MTGGDSTTSERIVFNQQSSQKFDMEDNLGFISFISNHISYGVYLNVWR